MFRLSNYFDCLESLESYSFRSSFCNPIWSLNSVFVCPFIPHAHVYSRQNYIFVFIFFLSSGELRTNCVLTLMYVCVIHLLWYFYKGSLSLLELDVRFLIMWELTKLFCKGFWAWFPQEARGSWTFELIVLSIS